LDHKNLYYFSQCFNQANVDVYLFSPDYQAIVVASASTIVTQAPGDSLSDGVTSHNHDEDEGVECIEDCDEEYEDEDDEQSETDEEDEESYYE
jgi:hypothetical protein